MMRQSHEGETVQLATRVPAALHRAVRLAAIDEDVSVQTWIADALTAHLATARANPVPADDASGPKGTLRSRVHRPRVSA